jgi:hypothetical protein
MTESGWTIEAKIGLLMLIISIAAFVLAFQFYAKQPEVGSVAETQMAYALTSLPSQTPWVVTATFTPTPIVKVGPR